MPFLAYGGACHGISRSEGLGIVRGTYNWSDLIMGRDGDKLHMSYAADL